MQKFLVDAVYCTRGGHRTSWSTSLEAADMASAQRGAHRAVNTRHLGATKIDLSIVRDPEDIADRCPPETSDLEGRPADTVELRIAIRLLDEQRLRGIATSGWPSGATIRILRPISMNR